MPRCSTFVATTLLIVAIDAGAGGGLAAEPPRPGSAAVARVDPRLLGTWNYKLDAGSWGQGMGHLDLRSDGSFEYVSALAIETTGNRYAQGYKYEGRYRVTGSQTILFHSIGKGTLVEKSTFDNLYERISRLDTKNQRAPDREYRWVLEPSGDAVKFTATDGTRSMRAI